MSTAESTSIALLNRLKSPHADMAWQRFVDLYGPLIFYWGRQRGLGASDAADLLQDVLPPRLGPAAFYLPDYSRIALFDRSIPTATACRFIPTERPGTG